MYISPRVIISVRFASQTGTSLRRRLAIGGGKERDLVTTQHEVIDQQLHQQLDAAVGGRRNPRPKRSDLCDAKRGLGHHESCVEKGVMVAASTRAPMPDAPPE